MTDDSGTTTYSYDARGNLVSQIATIDSISYTTSYAYNGADQLIQTTYPSDRTVDTTRNVLGQVASVTTTQGSTETVSSTLTYEPFGPMSGLIYGNNLVQSRSYDLDHRLTQLLTINGNIHQDLSQSYDAANNITAITNGVDNTRSQSLNYDTLNRLTDATSNYGDIDYAYDAIGNRLSETIDTIAETYTYDVNSHQLEQTQNGGSTTYTYDANGNTTSNTTNTFTFGDNNRLKTSGVGASTLATYTYNGRGERVKKDGSGTITYYHYDQSGQLIAETDATGTTLVEYVYLSGQPLALINATGIHYVHNTHLGTPELITDQTQATVWAADYSPFGEATITTELITNNIRGIGQYFDQETGLHYNYFRYLDPKIGRYVTSDPIGITAGVNTYGYVLQNPINSIDPTGLVTWKGKVTVSDVGYILGAALITAELTSECIDGKQYTVFVEGLVGGLNLGFLPVGSSSSNETLDDGLPDIDPYVFNGSAELGVISAQISQGYGLTDLKLGGARTPPNGMQPNIGGTEGFGEGALIMIGKSWLKVPPLEEDCGCQ